MGTYFQGAVKSGDGFSEQAGKFGTAVFSQSVVIDFDATLVQTKTLLLPKNAQILNIVTDVLTAYNSATSATLTVGSAAAGTQYEGAVDAKTAGRAAPVFTAAQLTAAADIGTNTTVYATVTSVGQPTAGQVRVTILYTGGSF